jgi:hypothetical protein
MKKLGSRILARLMLAAMMLALLSGCATVHQMAVTKETKKLDLKDKALLLMSLELNHEYKPDYQPKVTVVHLETRDADSKADRHNYVPDIDGTIPTPDGSRYLLRMEIDPGQYVLRGASGMYHSLFLLGSCMMPIHADIQAKPNTVTYLGRARGVTRARQDGEFRAGPLIPLVDQAVTGFAKSTFDVELSNHMEEDLKAYRMIFPALSDADIQVDTLPPFDRARAQAWWEGDGKSDKVNMETATKSAEKTSSEL